MQYNYNVRRDNSVYVNMRDPSFIKRYYRFKTLELIQKDEIAGSSPPDIFVGRIGYPNVFIGPLIPPQFGDTMVMGTPEQWVGKSIPEIVEYRSLLVRGMHKTKANSIDGRVEDMVRELAIADKCTDVDAMLKYKPSLNVSFSENSQPFGPSAQMKEMSLGNTKANQKVEAAHFDTAMNATKAIIELYEKGVLVSKIQKALSSGAIGIRKNRKFVPTRWGITAVDDTLSKYKLKTIKESKPIDSLMLFESVALDNRWIIIMIPGEWEYESIEAWYPNTSWNPGGMAIDIGASYEPYDGRKTYAEIGGCYYAARLAVSELLDKLKSQAKVLIMREVHEGYIMPVGVWNVREHVRETLKGVPKHFPSLKEALNYASTKLDIPVTEWIKSSTLLKHQFYQKRLA
ncbi:hypothetical protein M1394_03500 [Candidatus Marsarchaeota archaeon]|nr:hypothetical protein [Candidatus Marsarchaeota archaeon]